MKKKELPEALPEALFGAFFQSDWNKDSPTLEWSGMSGDKKTLYTDPQDPRLLKELNSAVKTIKLEIPIDNFKGKAIFSRGNGAWEIGSVILRKGVTPSEKKKD